MAPDIGSISSIPMTTPGRPQKTLAQYQPFVDEAREVTAGSYPDFDSLTEYPALVK